ncbi:MAG: chemotaxis response regulator protein-glutamate methylesterase [Candidatus Neomarinimicrobiota bacterium]
MVKKKTRVLVVDDSAFMRKLITNIVESDPELEVIQTARDGVDALKAVHRLKPDVVTLDIEMPEIDGITALVYIMEQFPTPVIMVTGLSTFLGEQTIKALEYGAVGFIQKPKGAVSANFKDLKKELIQQIKLAVRVDMKKLRPIKVGRAVERVSKPVHKSSDKIIVIASSSGGPRALSQIIPELPVGLAAGVVVIQHMPAAFIQSFANRLDWESVLDVKVAEDLEPVLQGKVLIMPADHHFRIVSERKNKQLIELIPLSREEKNRLISADEVMLSSAPIYGKNVVGVVLTGMGNDGTEGLKEIKKHGGYTIAEAESTAIVFGMSKAAIDAGVVDKIIPLPEIAKEIVKTVNS